MPLDGWLVVSLPVSRRPQILFAIGNGTFRIQWFARQLRRVNGATNCVFVCEFFSSYLDRTLIDLKINNIYTRYLLI